VSSDASEGAKSKIIITAAGIRADAIDPIVDQSKRSPPNRADAIDPNQRTRQLRGGGSLLVAASYFAICADCGHSMHAGSLADRSK
jgi:hypothetical protein